MARWSESFRRNITLVGELDPGEHLLEDFFITRTYTPRDERELQELEEFSLVASGMALMIHVAEADRIMKAEEKRRIIGEMTYQLGQREHEYARLADEFGTAERTIIENLFDRLLDDYEKGSLQLDKTIEVINKVFQNNPYSRYFLIRLCYYCALSDRQLAPSERSTIDSFASRLHVDPKEQQRIAREVAIELRTRA
jgi:tellurite resistance protein